jgi:VanZ family protein
MRRVVKASWYAAAAVLWMAFIFSLSSLPGASLGPDTFTVNFLKKFGHIMLFGVLSILYFSALSSGKPAGRAVWTALAWSFFLTVLYAAADEYHQSFTPGRHASSRDVAIDAFGALVFLCFGYLGKSRKIRPDEAGADEYGKTADYR